MLVRTQREGDPSALLVGMQAGAATLENSMEVPQKVKNRAILQFKCSDLKGHLHLKLWKEPRCPLTDEWIKKMWYIYTMDYTQS